MFKDAQTEPEDVSSSDTKDEPSAGKTKEPSPKPTFTQEEVDQQIAKRHGTLDRTIEDLKKERESMSARVSDAEGKLAQLLTTAQQAELEKFKDNPDMLEVAKARQQLANDRAEFEKTRTDSKARTAEDDALFARALLVEQRECATGVAEEYAKKGVKLSVDALVKLGGDTPEKMVEVAKIMADAISGQGPPQAEGGVPSAADVLAEGVLPDSGKGKGVVGTPTTDQLDAMSMDDFAKNWRARRANP